MSTCGCPDAASTRKTFTRALSEAVAMSDLPSGIHSMELGERSQASVNVRDLPLARSYSDAPLVRSREGLDKRPAGGVIIEDVGHQPDRTLGCIDRGEHFIVRFATRF